MQTAVYSVSSIFSTRMLILFHAYPNGANGSLWTLKGPLLLSALGMGYGNDDDDDNDDMMMIQPATSAVSK